MIILSRTVGRIRAPQKTFTAASNRSAFGPELVVRGIPYSDAKTLATLLAQEGRGHEWPDLIFLKRRTVNSRSAMLAAIVRAFVQFFARLRYEGALRRMMSAT